MRPNNRDDHAEAFCAVCRLRVAPYAPDREYRRGAVFHAFCLAQHELREKLQKQVDRARRRRAS